jgi:hypothetical protein
MVSSLFFWEAGPYVRLGHMSFRFWGLGLSLGWLNGGEATIYEFNGQERLLNAQRDIYLQAGLGRILKENLLSLFTS